MAIKDATAAEAARNNLFTDTFITELKNQGLPGGTMVSSTIKVLRTKTKICYSFDILVIVSDYMLNVSPMLAVTGSENWAVHCVICAHVANLVDPRYPPRQVPRSG